MNGPDTRDGVFNIGKQFLRENGDAILIAFARSDQDCKPIEVDILQAQAQGFHDPQATAVHQRAHQPVGLTQLAEYGLNLRAAEYHRKAPAAPGAYHVFDPVQSDIQDPVVKKHDGTQGLVLRCRGDVPVDRQPG